MNQTRFSYRAPKGRGLPRFLRSSAASFVCVLIIEVISRSVALAQPAAQATVQPAARAIGQVVGQAPARGAVQNILVVGDSLSCGPFGARLVEKLSTPNQNVSLYCMVSSTPRNWITGTRPPGQSCQTMTSQDRRLRPCGGNGGALKLADLLARQTHDRVIVGLGTNSLGAGRADADYRRMAEMIQNSGAACEWIGPPHLDSGHRALKQTGSASATGLTTRSVGEMERNLNSFYDSLANSVDQSCHFHDSRDLTARGTRGFATVDGVHRNQSAGFAWADALVPDLGPGARPGRGNFGPPPVPVQ